MSLGGFLLYGLGWLGFGALHSWSAGPGAKALFGRWLGRGYRLVYNLVSLASFLALMALGRRVAGVETLWQDAHWSGALGWAQAAAGLLGLAVLALALRGYDGAGLLGLRPLRGGGEDDDGPLRTGGLNAYVRHPLYSGLLLLIWGMAVTPLLAATAVWASLYLAFGIRSEERRLLARFGADYGLYRARVPMLIPWRGRVGQAG